MKPKVGVTLPQFGDDAERLEEAVDLVESGPLDSMWLFDHLWPLSGGKERPIFESWTTLAWIAGRTRDKTIGTLVTRSTLRHPALLAKMALTVCSIAPGRLVVAIGSGDEMSRAENEAFGIDYFEGEDRLDQLRSTVEAVVRSLNQPVVTQTDDFVAMTDLPVSPAPTLPVPVWVGGRSDDALEVAGTLADGWNGWSGSPERFAQDANTAIGYAEQRPFEVTWGGTFILADDDDEARANAGDDSEVLAGSPATLARVLGRYVEAGASHLILTPKGRWEPDTVRRLCEEVLPGLPEIPP